MRSLNTKKKTQARSRLIWNKRTRQTELVNHIYKTWYLRFKGWLRTFSGFQITFTAFWLVCELSDSGWYIYIYGLNPWKLRLYSFFRPTTPDFRRRIIRKIAATTKIAVHETYRFDYPKKRDPFDIFFSHKQEEWASFIRESGSVWHSVPNLHWSSCS